MRLSLFDVFLIQLGCSVFDIFFYTVFRMFELVAYFV